MAEVKGIKETTDVVVAANTLVISIIKAFKGGFDVGDIKTIIEENAVTLKNAIEGVGEVPAELKDLSLEEIIQLIGTEGTFLPELLKVILGK